MPFMRYAHHALLLVCSLAIVACSDGGDDSGPPSSPPSDPFAAVDAAARSAFNAEDVAGMGLAIYAADGTKVFERMYGDFAADREVAIASASKLVAGTVIFRLIGQGYLSLDSTTGEVLGWADEKSSITLRQLLSFTSGLASHPCTFNPQTTLADCVERIRETDSRATPGTLFDYNSAHLHVAARMAEVRVGSSWNQIFSATLVTPLGLPADLLFYTAPLNANGTTNPLVAGGLRASMNDYARVLRFVYDKGSWQGAPLAPSSLFDLQMVEPYANVPIRNSPARDNGFDFRYGLTAWLECSTPQTGCMQFSSPGAFGFTPWIDRSSGYYAVLGMEYTRNGDGIVAFAVSLSQQLKPLIADALRDR